MYSVLKKDWHKVGFLFFLNYRSFVGWELLIYSTPNVCLATILMSFVYLCVPEVISNMFNSVSGLPCLHVCLLCVRVR